MVPRKIFSTLQWYKPHALGRNHTLILNLDLFRANDMWYDTPRCWAATVNADSNRLRSYKGKQPVLYRAVLNAFLTDDILNF